MLNNTVQLFFCNSKKPTKNRVCDHINGPRCTAMHATTFSQCYIFLGHKTVISCNNVQLYAQM